MKSLFYFILLVCFFFTANYLSAQKNCGTDMFFNNELQEDPNLVDKINIIESYINQNAGLEYDSNIPEIIIIPVVVHVLYHNPEENISDEQILFQFKVINQDFNKKNADTIIAPDEFKSLIANIGIKFSLARQDPWGNSTTGIIRTFTEKTVFNDYLDDAKFAFLGGADAWSPDSYLNIWVVPQIIEPNYRKYEVDTLMGYAQFPYLKENFFWREGIVIRHNCFGTIGTVNNSYNDKGRTATHEIGHWLNLLHIWGNGDTLCGDDRVRDTPSQDDATFGCSELPERVTCSGDEHIRMTMNYMDYTCDSGMCMFTQGQRRRMRWLFSSGPAGLRREILNSIGGIDP